MINILDKNCCCACGACAAKCPTSAIFFKCDNYGNRYPIVSKEKCIHCNLCDNVCPLIKDSAFKTSLISYAAVLNKKEIKNSASGGAFFGLARSFLKATNGVVYGCVYNENLLPVIKGTSNVEELNLFQGSKYVMSTISSETFKEIYSFLQSGVRILFSGVPCQCSAVRMFCGNHKNLYTIELLCHGFVEQEYWSDYIDILKKKHRSNIVDFEFRNKDKGNFIARYITRRITKSGKIVTKKYYTNPSTSYYYNNFLSGKIYRENCYSCKYARKERISDLTIGDFWGYVGNLDYKNGISAIIVNSTKGNDLLELSKSIFLLEKSSVEIIAKNNGQLNKPVSLQTKDYSILIEWKERGPQFQDKNHRKKHFKAYLASKLGLFR